MSEMVIDTFTDSNSVVLEDYKFLVLPSLDSTQVQFLVQKKNSQKLIRFFCTQYHLIEKQEFFADFKIKAIFYVGNLGLLAKDINEKWWFKEVIFGFGVSQGDGAKITDSKKPWKQLSQGGEYVNSFYSKQGEFLIEFVMKDDLNPEIKIDESQNFSQSWDIVSFKYDQSTKNFMLYRRWALKFGEELKSKLLFTELLKITRVNSSGFIITFVQERHTFKREKDSDYSKKQISNI
jgi:hypothetical protein